MNDDRRLLELELELRCIQQQELEYAEEKALDDADRARDMNS